jgi:outer membrane protein assembly factor BamB
MKLIIFCLLILFTTSLFSQEIVEFRGIGRSGYYHETGLLKKWPESGPELFVKIDDISKGYSQPIVAESKIFITGIKGEEKDVISAYSLDGTLIWETAYGNSWTRSYPDSRCTPTYEMGKLYVASGTGQLNCINAINGAILWQVDVIDKYSGEIFVHGDAESPLIVNDVVVYTTGGDKYTMVAFNKVTGAEVWKTKSLGGAKSYASSVLVNLSGKDLILVQTTKNVIAVNSKNGEIQWYHNLDKFYSGSQGKGAQANPVLFFNNELFVTSGYDHPGILFSVAGDNNSVQVKWINKTLNTHHGGVVLVDGNLYGSNWQHNSRGKWASVNWNSGVTNWEEEWYNKGSVIYSDGMLYIYEEKSGNVALVEPSIEKLAVVSIFKVEDGAGPHWAHPAIYDGRLFIRHGSVLMVYNIKT